MNFAFFKFESVQSARRLATFLLVFCAVGMVVCRLLEAEHGWASWLRAMFEAATIGALADWFAVVALFRHPMGLPIPQTAILPKNKERVGAALANFIETGFLTERELGPRLRNVDYAGFAADWTEKHAAMLAGRVAGFLPGVLSGLSDEEMRELLTARARDLISKAELGPVAAGGLEVLAQGGRDREIFLSTLKSARSLIEEHRPTIQEKIRKEIPISGEMLRKFGPMKDLAGPFLDQLRESLAAAVASKTIEKVQGTLDEAGSDPQSPLWKSFEERLRRFIDGLKTSPEMAGKIRTMQDSLASSDVVEDFAGRAWGELKEFLLRDCVADDSLVRTKIEDAVRAAARQLAANPEARAELNQFIDEQVMQTAVNQRPAVRKLIVETVAKWDAREMTERLEETVGRDLQFIRLNGTIVGGIIGVFIHAAFWVIGK